MQFLGISEPSTNSAADEIIPVTPSSKTLSTHSVQHLNIKNSNMQTHATFCSFWIHIGEIQQNKHSERFLL